MEHEDGASSGYFWTDSHASDELTRLRLIEQYNDPSSFRLLD
ncbi:hypothetical protein [Mycobacterium vicinigordonae]|nr:hypothetical protein [Mycobacterium vicinigordonae]